MKINYNLRLLIITLIVAGISFLGCKKDNDKPTSSAIELLSFGPTGAQPGDTIRFFGNNLDQVTEIDFTKATVASGDFISQSKKEILVIVPAETEKGYVTLKTPAGDITSKTQFNIAVAATVTSITESARPGGNVTIKGDYLNWVTSVTFNDGKVVTTFVNQSKNQLEVTVPEDAQTGPLVLSYGGTDSNFVETADTLHVTLPIVTAVSPNPIKHALNVTLTGTDLDLVKQVKFTGVATPVTEFVSQSATSLVVKVPGEATKGVITVVAASGVSTLSSQKLDLIMPAITNMSPNPIDPEANLTIAGTNLDLVTGISLVGGAEPITNFVSQSASQIVVKVPEGTLKGKVTLSVLNSSLTVTSADDLVLNGGLPALADFPLPIYTDGPQSGFQDWSYTDTHDFYNTENVRQGTQDVKAVYAGNGYQGITFHNPNGSGVSTTGYTKLEFSVFGDAGTDGKTLNVVINGNYGAPTGVTIKEGEWVTFSLNLSALGSPSDISEIVLQSAGWSGTIHVDHVGLR
jgi:hypothetical protein